MQTFIFVVAFFLLMPNAFANAEEALADFLGPQGCAIGPLTRTLANNAGYGNDVIDDLIAQAVRDPRTIRTGEWVVLAPSSCRIRPSNLQSEIRIGVQEVVAVNSRIHAHVDAGLRGCFLFGPALIKQVQKTRGWDEQRANLEWICFAAENLRTGNLAFYGTNPSRPPPAFLVLTASCADILEIHAIHCARAVRNLEFNPLIRANGSEVVCGGYRCKCEA